MDWRTEESWFDSWQGVPGVFPGLKWLGSKADHLIPTGIEVGMCGVVPLLPLVPVWQACGHHYRNVTGFNKNIAYNF